MGVLGPARTDTKTGDISNPTVGDYSGRLYLKCSNSN